MPCPGDQNIADSLQKALRRACRGAIDDRDLDRRAEGGRSCSARAQRTNMNTDQTKGTWIQFVEKAKDTWGRLTDDDWKVVEGKRDQLVGKIQERYRVTRREA